METLEKEMPLLEKEKEEITAKMSAGDADYASMQKMGERLLLIEKELEAKETRWLELSEFQ